MFPYNYNTYSSLPLLTIEIMKYPLFYNGLRAHPWSNFLIQWSILILESSMLLHIKLVNNIDRNILCILM